MQHFYLFKVVPYLRFVPHYQNLYVPIQDGVVTDNYQQRDIGDGIFSSNYNQYDICNGNVVPSTVYYIHGDIYFHHTLRVTRNGKQLYDKEVPCVFQIKDDKLCDVPGIRLCTDDHENEVVIKHGRCSYHLFLWCKPLYIEYKDGSLVYWEHHITHSVEVTIPIKMEIYTCILSVTGLHTSLCLLIYEYL